MAAKEPDLIKLLLHKFSQETKFMGVKAGNEYYLEVSKEALPEVSSYLVKHLRASLATMIGNDERSISGSFRLYYYFAVEYEEIFIVLISAINPVEPAFPSITPLVPSAQWYEREVQDMFGLRPVGHPDPRRLVLHHDWPQGTHPLRKDFNLDSLEKLPSSDYPFGEIDGTGPFYVPVGPIHAGIIEPGHFRFSVAGETILNLEARLFYTHRGVEKLAEGGTLEAGLNLAERVCGTCAFSHSVSFCQAIERAANVQIPERALFVRTILLEMERLYNHIGDVGNICAGVGLALGTSHGNRIKEAILQLNQDLTGSRFLRGINAMGGLKKDISDQQLAALKTKFAHLADDFNDLAEILLEHDSLIQRLKGTGRLSLVAVEDLGVVGPSARASGCIKDWRKAFPHGVYRQLEFEVAGETSGDVLARLKVRVNEVKTSFDLIFQLVSQIPAGAIVQPVGELVPYQAALGWSESARGNNLHWVMIGPGNNIFRYRIRSASYCNWPAVPLAVQGNIIPDFPLINKSFELCYACTDR